MTFRAYVLSRRLLVVGLLLALPPVLIGLIRYYADPELWSNPERVAFQIGQIEYRVIFWLIPHALVPLVALVYSAGLIQDEIEDQTLTYLFVRPLAKWAIYGTKLLAAICVAALATAVFVTIAFAVLYWGTPNAWPQAFVRAGKTSLLLSAALFAYCSIFGFVGLAFKRALVLGVAYIVLFEGLVANVNFVVRRGTIMYYFRVLAKHWLELEARRWNIDLLEAPTATTCVLVLLISGVVVAAAAAWYFSVREFRVKTPGG
jgi:ABC-2 type transport system permease protein